MTGLITLGLAAWIIWETLLSVIPLRVHPVVQPLAVAALCYGLNAWRHPAELTVLASVAIVAIGHTFAAAEQPAPIVVRRGRAADKVGKNGVSRLPDLP